MVVSLEIRAECRENLRSFISLARKREKFYIMGPLKKAAKEKYDAVIIGVGQAGEPLAHRLVKEGYHTAVIEKDLEGGSCINYGCTPTKTMISSAYTAYVIRKSQEWGIHASISELDFGRICERRDRIVESFRQKMTDFLEKGEKPDFFRGTATFTGERKIRISLNDGGRTEFTGDKIFINTGTYPRIPEIDGLSQLKYYTAKNWMEIRELPESMLIVGGGYIGAEFAQMFRRLGTEVIIAQKSGQLLPREDEDIAAEITHFLEEENITVHLGSTVEKVRKADNKYIEVIIATKNEKVKKKVTHILIAAGTKPATEELNPGAAGIDTDENGYIRVNDRLETGVKGIYAMGDCKGGPEFTHISYDDFRIVSDQLFGEGKKTTRARFVPYTLFTDPELGRIGLNEKSARTEKISYRLAEMKTSHISRAIETNRPKGKIKVLIGEDDRLLGASVLAAEGGEIMAVVQIAMKGNLKYQDLRDAIFAHPTLSEGLNSVFMNI